MTVQHRLASDMPDLLASIYDRSQQNCIVIMEEDGIVLGVNQAFTNTFFYTEENIAGKSLRMMFTIEDQQGMLFEQELERVKTHGMSSDNNYLVDKHQTLIWVKGESILVAGKGNEGKRFIVKILQSIHEQKTLEKFLSNSNSFVESILKCIKDALVVVNADFKILKVNHPFCDTFSIAYESAEGSYLFEINNAFSADDMLKQKLQDVMISNMSLTEEDMEWTDALGKNRNFKLSTSLIDGHPNEEKRVLLVMREVTAEREANQQRDDLIGFVSHELRNPLANMVLCTELMEDSIAEKDLEEAKNYLDITKSNISRLKKITAELHDATKAGSGHLQIKKQPFHFEEMVDESIETVKLLNPEYRIIKTGQAAIMVHADRYRMAQVLTNYLSNAIKYSLQHRDIWIHLEVIGNHIITQVRDQGTGIAEDQIPFVFTRYYRAEKTKNIEGLGLGLYLSGEIIKAHQGRVWLNSKEGEGTAFYFSIPIV